MTDRKAIWLLDQRFDFLLPSFEKKFGIAEDEIQFVGSYHGTREMKNTLSLLEADKGHAAYREPEDINREYTAKYAGDFTDNDFIIPFSGAYLPENAHSIISTGEIAQELNNKWEQDALFSRLGIRTPKTFRYENSAEMLANLPHLFVTHRKLIIKKPELSGGYKMKTVSTLEEALEYCDHQSERFLDSEFLVSEYIDHKQSFSGMGVIGKDKQVNWCGVTEQVLYEDLAYEGLIWPPFIVNDGLDEIEQITMLVGKEMAKKHYYGYYNVDFIQGDEGMYAVEINARLGFGTILYALYCGDDFWDAIQGNKAISVSETTPDKRFIIGKIKGKEGKGYSGLVNDPQHGDIIKWFNGASERYREYFVGVKEREVFDYGSFVGLFGERCDIAADREDVLNAFWMRCLEQFGQQKTLLSMYLADYPGIETTTFNFDTCRRYIIGNNAVVRKSGEEITSLPKNFWGDNISALTLLIGENGAGKTSLLRLLIKWLCQLSAGHIPKENGALIIRDGDVDKLIAFRDGGLYGFKSEELLTILDIESAAEMLKDIHLVYYTDTMTDLDLDDRLLDSELEYLTDYSLITRLSQSTRAYSVDNNLKKSLKRGEFNRQIKLFINSLEADVSQSFPLRYVKLTVTNPADTDCFRGLERAIGDEAGSAIKVLTELWYTCFPKGEGEDDIPIRLTWSLFSGFISALLIWENNLPYSGDDTILGRLENSLGRYQSNTFSAGFEKLSDIFQNLYLDCKSLFRDEKRRDKLESTWGRLLSGGIRRFIDTLIKTEYIWPRWKRDGENIRGSHIYLLDLRDVKGAVGGIEGFKAFWQSYEEVADFMAGCEFDWNNPSSGEMNKANLAQAVIFEDLTHSDNLWVLLDEPDNTYHPEWQRNSVNDIIAFSNAYPLKYCQFFVCTHSPILLSDVPKQAVVLLRKDDGRDMKVQETPRSSTFGQQIYTLFDNAFFMKDGAVGTFAESKINKVYSILLKIEKGIQIQDLNELTRELHDAKKIIDMVKEPLTGGLLRQSYRLCEKKLMSIKQDSSM